MNTVSNITKPNTNKFPVLFVFEQTCVICCMKHVHIVKNLTLKGMRSIITIAALLNLFHAIRHTSAFDLHL